MKKYKCIVVEDEPFARNLLEIYINKVSQLECLGMFENPILALDFLRENKVDIIYSDIQMPEINGISFIKMLENKPIIVLTTAYSEFAIEGYELEVFDYLLKPISLERFLKSIEKILLRLETTKPIEDSSTPQNIFVKDGTKLVKINLNDILYIEGLKDYVSIITPNAKITSLQTFKSLETILPKKLFIRIHKSYIVAINAIESIEKDAVIVNKKYLPIGNTFKKDFKDWIDNNHLV